MEEELPENGLDLNSVHDITARWLQTSEDTGRPEYRNNIRDVPGTLSSLIAGVGFCFGNISMRANTFPGSQV